MHLKLIVTEVTEPQGKYSGGAANTNNFPIFKLTNKWLLT